jgi:hypothetical protein
MRKKMLYIFKDAFLTTFVIQCRMAGLLKLLIERILKETVVKSIKLP